MKIRTLLLLAGMSCLVATLSVSTAWSQDKESTEADVKRQDSTTKKESATPSESNLELAKQAYLAGETAFEAGQFETAVTEFKKSYRLSRNPLLLYNIGYTLDELDKKELAVFYFEKFQKEAPADARQQRDAKRRLRLLRRELKSTGNGQNEPTRKFMHNIVEEAPPGKPLDISVSIPEDAEWKLTLFYKGKSNIFENTAMIPRFNELVGRIPAAIMEGRAIQYYVEARNQKGVVVKRSGRSSSPHLVFIDPDVSPQYYPDLLPKRTWNDDIVPTGDGILDVGSKKFHRTKWIATGAAGVLLTTAVTSFLISSQASTSLEGEALFSQQRDTCASGRPCRTFSTIQKDLQKRGKNFQTVYRTTIALGVVGAGVASYFWYKDIKARKAGKERLTSRNRNPIIATPVTDGTFWGGAAAVRF